MGMMKVKQKTIKKTGINLDHIIWNDCGEKGNYAENNECSKQKNSKKMQKHSEKRSKKNLETRPLMDE